MTHIRGLITLLITTHEPPSRLGLVGLVGFIGFRVLRFRLIFCLARVLAPEVG